VIDAAEIDKMSIEERLQAMELLWASIASSPEEPASPAWHGEVLRDRLDKVARGEGVFLTLEQLKERHFGFAPQPELDS
jgi:putative addiction module component (TIGR02574 family)